MAKIKKQKLYSFFLPKEIKERIEKYQAAKFQTSKAPIIIRALDEFLEREGY